MAATWKLLPVQRFQNSKLQEEIICSPILADFARILTCSQDKILGVDHKDLLNIAVALYGNNLPEMSADTLFPVLTKKGVKTLLILKGNLAENFSCCTRSAPSGSHNDKGNNGKQDLSECGSNVLADKDESDQTLGEFSDIFSDSSDTDEASSEESDNDADFSSEFEKFVEKVRARKDKPDDGSIDRVEKMLIAAMTYDRSYSIPNETSVELLLLAVRKKYRKCGIGHWLLETLKDPGTSGPYDAICTYADPQAATFFATNGFTDDVILNSKFRKVGDNWLNSTPMCFIPRFTLCSSQKKAATCTESVTSLDIEELERNIRAWKMEQTIAYQKQMTCILAATQQLKHLKKTVESQQKAIARLKEENSKLHTKMDVSDADVMTSLRTDSEESRLNFDFVQQMMIENTVLSARICNSQKASINRGTFYAKLETLRDPLMFTELYFCGGPSLKQLEVMAERGFSSNDFITGPFGKGLYFSQSPRKAMEFSVPGVLLICLVGLGNTCSVVKEDFSRISPPEGCDSVMTIGRKTFGGDRVAGQEYVIYDFDQAVPIYLVEYEVEWMS